MRFIYQNFQDYFTRTSQSYDLPINCENMGKLIGIEPQQNAMINVIALIG